MNKVRVRVNGTGVKYFATKEEATKWALYYTLTESAVQKMLEYVDEAVDKSDLKDANEIIKYIMEKK